MAILLALPHSRSFRLDLARSCPCRLSGWRVSGGDRRAMRRAVLAALRALSHSLNTSLKYVYFVRGEIQYSVGKLADHTFVASYAPRGGVTEYFMPFPKRVSSKVALPIRSALCILLHFSYININRRTFLGSSDKKAKFLELAAQQCA